MSKAKKAFSILLDILTFFIIIIFLFALYSFIQIKVLNKEYVNIFGYSFLQVKSGSMENEIHVDDIVIDKLLKLDDEIKEEDIISFKDKNAIITHRVISISGDTIITKGDANNTIDDPISRDQVIGKVIKILSGVSLWIRILKTKSVLILTIITFVLFIISISIDTSEENDKNTQEKNTEDNNEEKKN